MAKSTQSRMLDFDEWYLKRFGKDSMMLDNSPQFKQVTLWCEHCEHWFLSTPKTFKGDCPKCNQRVTVRKCHRCGGEWKPRSPMNLQKYCTRCTSPYWCIPK